MTTVRLWLPGTPFTSSATALHAGGGSTGYAHGLFGDGHVIRQLSDKVTVMSFLPS